MTSAFKFLVVAAAAAAASSVLAATGAAFSNLGGAEYDTAGVWFHGDVTYTANMDDGGGFDLLKFQLWDDGTIKYEKTFSLGLGLTSTFHVETSYPGLIGTSAPGLGLVLEDVPTGSWPVVIDPFFLPHYKDPSECTFDCTPPVPEPSSYAMMLLGLGALVAGAKRAAKRR